MQIINWVILTQKKGGILVFNRNINFLSCIIFQNVTIIPFIINWEKLWCFGRSLGEIIDSRQ